MSEDNELIVLRKAKLAAMREAGNAFPNDFRRDSLAGNIHEQYAAVTAEQLEEDPVRVVVAGRLMSRRVMGKASFAHVQDMSGRIQLFVQRDSLPEGFYNGQFKKAWDVGDIIGAEGQLFRTKTGELSIKVDGLKLLTKSLRPLPEKWHGLTDTEQRYRQRYLDLIMNESVRSTFKARTRIIDFIRRYLTDMDYLEVETPMMQSIPGGAAARPFVTHHNALDMKLYLRIAPELYLKRLVVGGIEKVFEINRNFRNEGVSTQHNPEFTMLEFYQSYADYHDLMDITEDMLRGLAQEITGDTKVSYQEQVFDFGKPFARMTLKQAIVHFNDDIDDAMLEDETEVRRIAGDLEIPLKDSWGLGKVQVEIFEKTVEHRLQDPTFITAYPTEVSPLARRNDDDPFVTDRFEFFIGGREIANGFSELNDAEDQAARFADQVKEREAGDHEAMYFDEDYVTALEYGLPPTAGEGIGIDLSLIHI